MQPQETKIGLIAGNGRFPYFFAQAALARGVCLVICCIEEEADPSIVELVGRERCHWIPLGALEKLIEVFKKNGVTRAVMAGKVTKTRLFKGLVIDPRLARALAALPNKSDDALLLAVVRELQKDGIELLDSTLFLKDFFVSTGTLTSREPTEKEWADIRFGFMVAKKMASLDIGQSVVVKDRAVMAIEAIEGTDECIARGSQLGNGRVVVVKVAKPRQDMRFDIPVVGLGTLEKLCAHGAAVLALEADKVLFLDRPSCLDLANRKELALVSVAFDILDGENGKN